MQETPLYNMLRAFAQKGPLRMHMPGHKGKPLPASELSGLSTLDFTELGPTGNLFDGGGAIGQAETLWAAVYGVPHCLFLTGGSTQGIHAALSMTCRPGGRVLVDRCCHRSVFHALALLDLTPVYLERPWRPGPGLLASVPPEEVDRLLTAHPGIQALCLTSPTYYGVLSDLPAIARVTRRHGTQLVVDAAHGAHLPFLGDCSLSAADVAVVSAHKTLPAPGQTALLLAGDGFTHSDLRRWAAVYGTSSPSYALMAALDVCRAYLEGEGGTRYRRTAEAVSALRERFPCVREEDGPLDPTRLVLCCGDGGSAQTALEGNGVYPEMADRGHLICILTSEDGAVEIARLSAALEKLDLGQAQSPAPPPLPEVVLSPRTALFAARIALPLEESVGHICAQSIAPYPPGIPIVAPGERIEKKTVAYLAQIGYNMVESIEVVR